MTLGAIILAAGFSSRMGRFKPLLPLGKTTVLGQVVDTLNRAGVEEIRVVAGHRAGEVLAAARELGVAGVENREFERGMFSSIQAGCRTLQEAVSGFLLWPVDIPLVRSWTVAEVGDAWADRSPDTSVIYPCYDGERGHPPLVSGALIPGILAHDGPGGMRGFLEGVEAGAREVAVWDRFILADMDTPGAYERIRRHRERWDLLTPEEAEVLMSRVLDPDDRIKAHGRVVARVAVDLARELNEGGHDLDLDLVYGAALLHDVAKGEPDHETRGGKILSRMGLERLGEVVAAHKETCAGEGPVTEAELVCLADKRVQGERVVDLDTRFGARLGQFRGDADACAGVERRWAAARGLAAKVERALGRSLK